MPQDKDPNRLEGLWLRALSSALGALPDHAGQFRVASAYLRRWPPRRRLAVQRMRGGLHARLDIGDRTQGIAYLTRRYEPELVDYVVARLPPGGLFIDVGAHVGLISLAVARRRPAARVVSFEPSTANAAAWEFNRKLNGLTNASLIRSAIADCVGSRPFHEDGDSVAGHLAADGTASVNVTSLDQFAAEHHVDYVDVLKVDTEGGERAVLEGAAGLLQRRAIGSIVCELNTVHLATHGQRPEEITSMLRGAGFHQVRLPERPRRLRPRSTSPAVVIDVAYERTGGPRERNSL
jgi:FkbM family methyltransferase